MCIQFKYEFFMQMQAQRNTNRHTKKKAIYIYMYCQVLYIAKTANPKNKMKLLNHLITHLQFLSRIPFEN